MAKRKLSQQQQRRIRENQNKKLSYLDLSNTKKGLVISHFGKQLIIETDSGELLQCKIRQNLGDITCGDVIAYTQDANTNETAVVAIHPRKNRLVKTGFGGNQKTVAANIDQVIIVASLEPDPNLFLIDRYIVAAESIPATPVIVLNKIDLKCDRNEKYVEQVKSTYEPLGYQVIITSAKKIININALEKILQGKTSILVGLSGVGKSTITNDLIPDLNTRTGELSNSSGEGKHTTTVSSLYHLPNGGDLIDSPGVRDFTPVINSKEDLITGFVEFKKLDQMCKFSNCTHNDEPGCVIKQAINENKISTNRSKSFLHLQNELAEQ